MEKLRDKINSLLFGNVINEITNASNLIQCVTLLEDLRHELKILSSVEYENKFFKETKQKSFEQPYNGLNYVCNSYDFIVFCYKEEILKKRMGSL